MSFRGRGGTDERDCGSRVGFEAAVRSSASMHMLTVRVPARSGVRPFGVSLLVAGFDNARGHTLYQVDPSGSFWAWKASAIGKNQVNAKTFLEKRSVG